MGGEEANFLSKWWRRTGCCEHRHLGLLRREREEWRGSSRGKQKLKQERCAGKKGPGKTQKLKDVNECGCKLTMHKLTVVRVVQNHVCKISFNEC